MEEFDLQPLRITSGWNVEWNLFYEVDPSEKTMHYLDSSSLLHLSNYNTMRAIDLDFRLENDVNGCFYLRVINLKKVENPKTKKIKPFYWFYFLIIRGVSLKNTAKKITIKVPISKNV